MAADPGTPWWRVLLVFMRDSAGPAAVAALYAWWAHQTRPDESWPDLIQRFGVAYFFLMWFVGQFARVAKRLDDRAQLQQIQQDVAAIKDAIRKTGAQPESQTAPERVQAIQDPTARALISEAWAAFESGLLNSALVMAAVAFEHSLRSKAERSGVDSAERVPVGRLLELLSKSLEPGVVEDLRGLWRTRNTLVHMREDQMPDLQLARSILENFMWAVQLLSR